MDLDTVINKGGEVFVVLLTFAIVVRAFAPFIIETVKEIWRLIRS